VKKEVLGELEKLSEAGEVELFYGDESGVNLEPCVPYGWQFADEAVSMPSAKGKGINCFGLFTRSNKSLVATSENSITAGFVVEQLERLSFAIEKITVVVLDNARIHTGRQMRERIEYWQRRGLFIFYLPTYSPHLNIAETFWRKLKYEWLAPSDYEDQQRLRYSVKQALNEFGKSLGINFSDFNHSLN
jgi:transposase